MTSFAGRSFRWVGRHAIPAVAVTLIVGAAAGGGITYAMTSAQPAATKSATPAPTAGTATNGRGAPFVRQLVAMVAKDTGVKVATIRADLANGESLDQIAGANATKVENDIVTALTTALSKRVPNAAAFGSRFAHGTSAQTAIRARVHALMAEPGTQLLQQLAQRRGVAGPLTSPGAAKRSRTRTRATPSPSPSAAA